MFKCYYLISNKIITLPCNYSKYCEKCTYKTFEPMVKYKYETYFVYRDDLNQLVDRFIGIAVHRTPKTSIYIN